MRGRRALILGVSGQDGSYLAELLVANDYEVSGLARNPQSENLDEVRGRIEVLRGDMLEEGVLAAAITHSRPDEIYCLAAASFVPTSWDEPLLTAQFAAFGMTSLLEIVRRMVPPPRLFYASSAEVFGATSESPQSERTPFCPSNPYGAAKLYAQSLIAAYRERYGLHASSAILYNHESPRRDRRFLSRKVTDAAAAISLGFRDKLELGDLSATRDWGYAGDYVQAMWRMLQSDEPDDYVVATGVGRSVRDLVDVAFACAGVDPRNHVVVAPALVRPPESVVPVGDASKAAERLGWRPVTGFEEMIASMVAADQERLRASRGSGIDHPVPPTRM